MIDIKKELFRTIRQLMTGTNVFYGYVLNTLDISFSDKIPTAGVALRKETMSYVMYINPEFFEGLTGAQRQGLLIHELLHLVFDHCSPTWKRVSDRLGHTNVNVAMDMEINQQIDANLLPPDGVSYSMLAPLLAEVNVVDTAGLERLVHITQTYGVKTYLTGYSSLDYTKIMSMIKQQRNSGNGSGENDDSDEFSDANNDVTIGDEGTVDELAQTMAKNTLAVAIDNVLEQPELANAKSRGDIPGGVLEAIARLKVITPPATDYRKILSTFVGRRLSSEQKPKNLYPNARYEAHDSRLTTRYAFAGDVLLAVDTSGSVSSEELSQFSSEIDKIRRVKRNVNFHLIEVDAELQSSRKLKRNESLTHVHGRGGTNMRIVFEYAAEAFAKRLIGALILFSDGDVHPNEVPVDYVVPTLIVFSNNHNKSFDGTTINTAVIKL
jgi:predicted metal-dependent peptidase